MPEPEAEGGFQLWAEHLPALEAFLTISGQWRAAPTPAQPIWLGLDYAAVQAGWCLAGLAISPELFAEVREIEAGALEILKNR